MSYDLIETGRRIMQRRKQIGMTQEQLAESVHCTAQHISRIERGVHGASFETICAISQSLNVSLDYLAFGYSSHNQNAKELLKRIQEDVETLEKMCL